MGFFGSALIIVFATITILVLTLSISDILCDKKKVAKMLKIEKWFFGILTLILVSIQVVITTIINKIMIFAAIISGLVFLVLFIYDEAKKRRSKRVKERHKSNPLTKDQLGIVSVVIITVIITLGFIFPTFGGICLIIIFLIWVLTHV